MWRWQPWPMGEAGAGAARSSVAEVAPLVAVARGISARPGMRGSLTVTKEAEKELLGGLQGVFGSSPRRQMPGSSSCPQAWEIGRLGLTRAQGNSGQSETKQALSV